MDVRSGKLLANKLVIEEDLTPQIDGIKVEFTVANDYDVGTMMIYLNGLRQQKGAGKDYIEVSPNKIEFFMVPDVDDIILADYIEI